MYSLVSEKTWSEKCATNNMTLLFPQILTEKSVQSLFFSIDSQARHSVTYTVELIVLLLLLLVVVVVVAEIKNIYIYIYIYIQRPQNGRCSRQKSRVFRALLQERAVLPKPQGRHHSILRESFIKNRNTHKKKGVFVCSKNKRLFFVRIWSLLLLLLLLLPRGSSSRRPA